MRFTLRSSRRGEGCVRERIDHAKETVPPAGRQVLGVKDRGAGALGSLKNERMPKGDLVTHLDIECLDDGCWRVDHDLPAQIVVYLTSGFSHRWRPPGLATNVDAKFLENLSAENTSAGIPDPLVPWL